MEKYEAGEVVNKTKIEWCDSTLNPVIGCTYGCEFCYARKLNNRFGWNENFEVPKFYVERLKKLENKKSQNIFMDSMSDLADWQDHWIEATFKAIEQNPQHNYLFLTKRPEICTFITGENIWNGVTITCENEVSRFNRLPAQYNRFASIEPIMEDLLLGEKHNLFFGFIHWVIIGAETGNRKNKVIPKKEWIVQIVSDCDKYDIPVFMKESLVPIVGEENMRRDFPMGLRKII